MLLNSQNQNFCDHLKNSNIISTTNKKVSIIYFFKRKMYLWQRAKEIASPVKSIIAPRPPINTSSRQFATTTHWSAQVRVQPPLKKYKGEEPPSFTAYDKLSGFEIMYNKDVSGSNHILFVDKTFVSDDYYLVLGCFTSSSNIIKGILPEKISDYQFNGKEKAQYFLRYPKPKLILKQEVKLAKLDMFEGSLANLPEDLKNFLKTVTPTNKELY